MNIILVFYILFFLGSCNMADQAVTTPDSQPTKTSAEEAKGDKLATFKGKIEIIDKGVVFLPLSQKKGQGKLEYLVKNDPSGKLKDLQGHVIIATGYFAENKADIRYYLSIKPWGGPEINSLKMVMVGIVKQLGFSIYMQGTHILENEYGELLCLLKSRTVTLDDFLNKRVKLKGKYSRTIEGEQIIIWVDSIQVVS